MLYFTKPFFSSKPRDTLSRSSCHGTPSENHCPEVGIQIVGFWGHVIEENIWTAGRRINRKLRKVYNEEHHSVYQLLKIVNVTKRWCGIWTVHTASTEKMKMHTQFWSGGKICGTLAQLGGKCWNRSENRSFKLGLDLNGSRLSPMSGFAN